MLRKLVCTAHKRAREDIFSGSPSIPKPFTLWKNNYYYFILDEISDFWP